MTQIFRLRRLIRTPAAKSDRCIARLCFYGSIGRFRCCGESSPAVPLGGSALDDGLHEDTQLLQAGVSAHPHPDDADPQAVVVWGGELKTVCECFIDAPQPSHKWKRACWDIPVPSSLHHHCINY